MSEATLQTENLRPAIYRIIAVSAAAFGFLVWLLYFKNGHAADPNALSFLPAVNAALNGLAATCITAGVLAIKTGRKRLHVTLMITALILSVVFLISYIVYHDLHGDTKFVTEGAIRYVYFFILISHILCTIFALPLIMTAVFFALTRRYELHKKVVKYTVPLWLYVSITGVVIYFLLRANS